MAQLLIRHDQELQSLRKMDQFILFLNPDPTGALHILLQETVQWKQQMDTASKFQMRPLRQHLLLALLEVMRTRAGKIVESKETDELYQTSLAKGLILQDKSFPFHRWDPQSQTLVMDKKQPVSAKKMEQHLNELLEMMVDKDLIIRFHALKAPDAQKERTVPWRLQVNLRSDRAYELLMQLAHNAIWMVVGATMKQHTLAQSPMATMLQNMTGQNKGKGQGKGKGKPKQKTHTGKNAA
jgi:hypothetical protein